MVSDAQLFPPVCTARGAPMGRPNVTKYPTYGRPLLHLRRFWLNSGGYDFGGAYWGHGEPLYVAVNNDKPEQEVFLTFRAHNREDAKRQVLEIYPGARFYR